MEKVRKVKRFDLLVFIFVTMLISGASAITENDFTRVLICFVLVVYCVVKKRPLLNKVLVLILCIWVLLNLIAALYFNKNIEVYQFLGKITLVYGSYLILTSCNNFWDNYESFLYKLVIISLIIYIFSLLFPPFFNQLSNFFRPFTNDVFYQKESQQNYFYSFFFVYHGGDLVFRNSGFMWEPGAYAMLLIILITYNLVKNGLIINNHIKIYLVALISTFSTAGYIALFLMVCLFIQITRKQYFLIALFFALLFIGWTINADFFIPKIKTFIEAAQYEEVYYQGYRDLYEANRLLSFKFLFDKFLILPTGWGCVPDTVSFLAVNDIVTVNGLGQFLVTWGIFACPFFVYSIGRFYYQYCKKITLALVCVLMVFICFFSNPIENNILPYILIISPYMENAL